MRKFGFENENGSTFTYGIRFLEFPQFKYGSEITQETRICGRKGTLIVHTGIYTDTIIENSLEFDCADIFEYEKKMRAIRQWLLSTKKLVYTDMEDSYFIVKKTEIDEESRKYGVYGNISVVFTCSPSLYLNEGDYEIKLSGGSNSLFNPYSESQPIYKISGNGTCVITVNGKPVKVDVNRNITVDTELMIAYMDDTMKNTAVTGKYTDLNLMPGDNTVTISNGFTAVIIPKWRILA